MNSPRLMTARCRTTSRGSSQSRQAQGCRRKSHPYLADWDGLRAVVGDNRKTEKRRPVVPRVSEAGGGLLPGVDLTNSSTPPKRRLIWTTSAGCSAPDDLGGRERADLRIPERSPQHRVCQPWLAAVMLTDARFGLSPTVLSAVVRITTNGHRQTPVHRDRHTRISR